MNPGNRVNQCNPNNFETGPGRNAAYSGKGDKPDKDNHANQLNPNNSQFGGGNTKK
uniref:Uncharacterized protein n=1 Tax=Tetranychus urticae TaxID=32264 RepID=T1L0V5_TETUR